MFNKALAILRKHYQFNKYNLSKSSTKISKALPIYQMLFSIMKLSTNIHKLYTTDYSKVYQIGKCSTASQDASPMLNKALSILRKLYQYNKYNV